MKRSTLTANHGESWKKWCGQLFVTKEKNSTVRSYLNAHKSDKNGRHLRKQCHSVTKSSQLSFTIVLEMPDCLPVPSKAHQHLPFLPVWLPDSIPSCAPMCETPCKVSFWRRHPAHQTYPALETKRQPLFR